MADNLTSKLLSIVPFAKKAKAGGTTATPTYNPAQGDQILTVPQYREHQDDLFTARNAENSQSLMRTLFEHDPDVSGTVNGYLTLADTQMIAFVEDLNGQVDLDKSRELQQLITKFSFQTDYTLGYQMKSILDRKNEEARYYALLRGTIAAEIIFDKAGIPDDIRLIDAASLRWKETKPGVYKPFQVVPGQSDPTPIDTPAFFTGFFRRSPVSPYTVSPFVSAINTIAARQQVINDLYRIMRATGYPRIEITVMEEILLKNLPPALRAPDQGTARQQWVNDRMAEIQASFDGIAVDQTVVHPDSVTLGVLNKDKPGMTLNIAPVIEVLNAQNQAALKTMGTVLGRGSSGVNTGSVEARLFALYADQLNEPLADMYSRMFSFILHQGGYQGFARVYFEPAELRPWTELEPQLTLKSQRLRQDLSDGIITDAEYHLQVHKRLPPEGSPELSGTGFMTEVAPGAAAPEDVSPKTDSVGRASSPDRTRQTAANAPKRRSAGGSRRLAANSLISSAQALIGRGS